MAQIRKIFEHAQELSGRMIVRGVNIGPLPVNEAMALVIRTLDEERDRIEELEAKLAQSVIAEYDDGSRVQLFSFAGGASVGGAWSELTIRHDLPDGTSMLRDYKAAGDWYAFPVAETEGREDD